MSSAASWQIQSQRKAQSGFLWFGVKFNPWRVLMGEGADFLGLFFLPLWSYTLCRAQFLPGRVDKYSIRSNLDVCPHLSPSEAKRFGRSLLQRGARELTAEALLNGPVRSQGWWMMQTQPREAMLEQTGVMSALATDGKAPSPALHRLRERRSWWMKNNKGSRGLTTTFISVFVLA